MSKKHPIIAITGSSGAGTTFVQRAFEKIFSTKKLNVSIIEGDSFHKFERTKMKTEVEKSRKSGKVLTHFSENANHFDKIEALFKQYGKDGSGQKRYYIHSEDEALHHNNQLNTQLVPGQFTPWENIAPDSDLLFYEGLHGGVKTADINIAEQVDLLVGVVPVVNIEWIQKIHRDTTERPYTPSQVTAIILERMPDYVQFITPQFDNTHINFQRIPLIDTANPFSGQTVPSPSDSLIVTTVRINDINLDKIAEKLPENAAAFLQNKHTLVCKGNYMALIMDLMLAPIIDNLTNNK